MKFSLIGNKSYFSKVHIFNNNCHRQEPYIVTENIKVKTKQEFVSLASSFKTALLWFLLNWKSAQWTIAWQRFWCFTQRPCPVSWPRQGGKPHKIKFTFVWVWWLWVSIFHNKHFWIPFFLLIGFWEVTKYGTSGWLSFGRRMRSFQGEHLKVILETWLGSRG